VTPHDQPRFRDLVAADAAAGVELLAGASPAPRRAPSATAVGAAWSTRGAGFAVDDGGLAALATLLLTPSIYTGTDWAHIEDVVARAGAEARLARPLLEHALQELEARDFPQVSVGVPAGQEWLAAEARAMGLSEELRSMSRAVPDGSDVTGSALPAGLTIRAAHDGDATALSGLIALFAAEFGHPSAADATTVVDFLRRDGTGCLIAEYGDVAAGFVATSTPFSLRYGGLTLMIDDLVVRPELRRRGIGRALVKRTLAWAAARDCAAARLWMEADDATARAFYTSLGFADDGHVLMPPAEGAQSVSSPSA
jgi:GNAT superfamily N-acetyltransferase